MGMFKIVATGQLRLLCYVLLLGSAFRALPTNPANACGSGTGLLYRRAVLAYRYLLLAGSTATMLHLAVTIQVRTAEAAAAARAARARAFGAGHNKGVGSVAARLWLRGTLLLAVALSFAASVLAVVVSFEDGWFVHRTGRDACRAGHGAGSASSRPGALMLGGFALLHWCFAWAAVVTQN